MKVEFSRKIFESTQISNFMKVRLVGAQLFHADGRTEITKITVGFRHFASMSKNEDLILIILRSRILLRFAPNCTARDAHKNSHLF
jgi:hypothetical protein